MFFYQDGCVVLTKLILAFGENQLSSLFDGLLYGDDSTKHLLLEFMNLIMVNNLLNLIETQIIIY